MIDPSDPVTRRRGVLAGLTAFVFWGTTPLYWSFLGSVPPASLLAWRILLGALTLWIAGWLYGELAGQRAAIADPQLRRRLLLAAVLNALNWFTYLVAVSSGRVVDASLGYYINPLVSVFLGTVVLGERLNRMEQLAITSAAAGVLYLSFRLASVPWFSLILAFSFGLYGLIKKRVAVRSIASLTTELTLLAPFAALGLVLAALSGGLPLAGLGLGGESWLLVLSAGAVTVLPLLFFGAAALRIRLSSIGFLQYIAPTMILAIGTLVFDEPFSRDRLVGFVLVWLGLVLYSLSLLRRIRRPASPGAGNPPALQTVPAPPER